MLWRVSGVLALLFCLTVDAFVGPSTARHFTPAKEKATSRTPFLQSMKAETKISRRDAAAAIASSLLLFSGAPLPAHALKNKATSEETVDAWRKLNQALALLKSADTLVTSKDWKGVSALLEKDEFKDIENNLLKLVSGPILSADDRKTIGTRKRYGIAADVIYGVGGIQSAIAAIDNPQLQGCSSGQCSGDFVSADVEVPKSVKALTASLTEILTICKSYKDFS